MENWFCLKFTFDQNEPLYLDIPGSRCEDGVQVEGYVQRHGGPNQRWVFTNDKIVSFIDYPSYSLGVSEIKDAARVFLRRENTSTRTFFNQWMFEGGNIKLMSGKDFCLNISPDGFAVLQRLSNENNVKWEKVRPKPATSCYLTYDEPPSVSGVDSWTLENTVCVRNSASSTYFCVVGWGPGGYSGIQQAKDDKRFTIFSMWDDGKDKVSIHKVGAGVQTASFGGEGKGMKSKKLLDWKNNEKISFRITGNKRCGEGSNIFWECSCWYSIQGSDWVFMATYRRSGESLPFKDDFYSFIENWDRSDHSEGYKMQRRAEFSGAKLVVRNNGDISNNSNSEHVFDTATFKKVLKGDDRYAADVCFGGVKWSFHDSFMLSTGGESKEIVQESLEKHYELCTSTSSSDLYLGYIIVHASE